jgi:hypothetical protein
LGGAAVSFYPSDTHARHQDVLDIAFRSFKDYPVFEALLEELNISKLTVPMSLTVTLEAEEGPTLYGPSLPGGRGAATCSKP